MAAYLSDSYQIEIGFAQWMIIGVPLSLSMLIISWVWLTKFAYKVDKTVDNNEKIDTKAVFSEQFC